jgi:hypothetical protein
VFYELLEYVAEFGRKQTLQPPSEKEKGGRTNGFIYLYNIDLKLIIKKKLKVFMVNMSN